MSKSFCQNLAKLRSFFDFLKPIRSSPASSAVLAPVPTAIEDSSEIGVDLRRRKNDWKNWPKTEDGQFACTVCKGKKGIWFDGIPKGDMVWYPCPECAGTGYLVESLRSRIASEYSQTKQESHRKNELIAWIKRTSNCKTCRGDQYKTLGGSDCLECGLPGQCPWGG